MIECAPLRSAGELRDWRCKLHDLPRQTTIEYATEDVRLALLSAERQLALGRDAKLIDWECRAMRQYCRMAAQGIRLDLPYIANYE